MLTNIWSVSCSGMKPLGTFTNNQAVAASTARKTPSMTGRWRSTQRSVTS